VDRPGRVTLADGTMVREREAWVADNARVTGAVELGTDVNVWYGASIRGDEAAIRIGARTNLQDNCVAHCDPDEPLLVGEDCTVGHGAILHGTRVGNRCLVGMGAILLQGSEVGDECLIGAGTLVTAGMKVPPRSVVLGVPGKVVRKVTDDEVKGFLRSAKGYVELALSTCGGRHRRLV
jgi:carbonic anhydrase/acetyltransferase-like protein (isoleucine patch superfamily)